MKPVPLVIPLAAAAVLFGAGWWIRRESTVGIKRDVVAAAAPVSGVMPAAPKPLGGKPSTAAARGAARTPAQIRLAVQRCDSYGDPLATRERLLELVEGMSAEELAAAVPALFGDRVFRTLAAQRWAELDPVALYTFLRGQSFLEMDQQDEKSEVSSILFRTWAKLDPQAAYEAAVRERLTPAMKNGLWSVVSVTLAKDPAAGLRLAEGLAVSGGYERINAAEITAENAADFAKAWANLPPGQRFESRIPSLANKAFSIWAESAPHDALAWVRTRSDAERVEHMPEILRGLAAKDFPAALTAFDTLPPSPERERAGPALAARLAATDPAAAIAWAESALAGGRAEAMGEIAAVVAAADPKQAAALAETMAPGASRDLFLAKTANTWAKSNLTEAAAWAQQFETGPERRQAIRGMAETWIEQHPESFAAYAAEAPKSEIPEHLLSSTASALVTRDPAEAVEWIMALDGNRSQRALAGAIGSEVFSDHPDRLTQLLGALPGGDVRDNAIRQSLSSFASFAPERAEAWLSTIDSGPLRERVASLITETPSLNAKSRAAWTQYLSSSKGQ